MEFLEIWFLVTPYVLVLQMTAFWHVCSCGEVSQQLSGISPYKEH